MKKWFYVYVATNLVNNKKYVGKTYNIEKRRMEHIYCMDDNLPFHRAIKKYGISNFFWQIVDFAYTDKEICEKEAKWIKKLHTCVNDEDSKGYNITVGGEGGVSWNSEPVVQMNLDGNYIDEFMSATSASVMLGIDRKSLTRACTSETHMSGNYLWCYKEDYGEIEIKPYKGKINKNKRKAVVQLDLEGNFINEFDSVTIAGEQTGTSRTSITGCLRGTYSRANGYQWIYKKDYNPDNDYKYKGMKKGDEIIQLTKDNQYVASYRNCAEAARAIGKDTSAHKVIHKYLDKENSTAYGYKWLRYETYKKQEIPR